MRDWKSTVLVIAGAVQLMAGHAAAQVRMYDGARDAAAQEAKKSADKIRNGEIFRLEAQNLQALIEKDIATTVADARLEMRAMINRLRQWSDVEDLSGTVRGIAAPAAPEQVAARRAEIAAARTGLQGQIKALSASAAEGSDTLDMIADRLGNVESALKFAEERAVVNGPAIAVSLSAIKQLQGLYKSYQEQFDAVNKAEQRLSELKVSVKKALLARLKVEEDYLLTQVAIHARSEQELKQSEGVQRLCAIPEGIPPTEPIDETLDRLANNRPALERALRSLYACGSLASEGLLPKRLLTIRLAHLEHMRSIQISAANAKVYEAVLGGGVERLALFYQGGIKPATLAQLIQSLSTAGVFGKLLTQ